MSDFLGHPCNYTGVNRKTSSESVLATQEMMTCHGCHSSTAFMTEKTLPQKVSKPVVSTTNLLRFSVVVFRAQCLTRTFIDADFFLEWNIPENLPYILWNQRVDVLYRRDAVVVVFISRKI